jgi:hypothetical protein
MRSFSYLLLFVVLLHLQNVSATPKDTARTIVVKKDSTTREPKIAWNIRVWVNSGQHNSPHISEIPFTMGGNLVLVEAELNGQKGFFILDSGAPGLKINAKHLKMSASARTVESTSGGITGELGEVQLQTIQKFEWNNIQVKNIQVEAFNLSHVEQAKNHKILGLIGYEVFRDFEMLLDYRAFQVVLYELDNKGDRIAYRNLDTTPTDTIPFKMAGHVPILRVKVDEFHLRFGLDTGAELNVLDVRTNPKVLQHFKITKRFFLNGNGKNRLEVLGGKTPLMTVGKVKYTNMRGILTNMDKMNKAYGTSLDGILGYEFLYRNKTAINFRKQTLYIWQEHKASPVVKAP